MGLQLPGSAFVNPGTPLRRALTEAAGSRVAQITALGDDYTPIGQIVDERAIVNGVVALLATGGSTNPTLHLVAIARRRRHPAGVERLRRAVARGPAAGADLPQRRRRRQPLPRRRRDLVPDRRAARPRPDARGREDGRGRRPASPTPRDRRSANGGELRVERRLAARSSTPPCCGRRAIPSSPDGGLRLLTGIARPRGREGLARSRPSAGRRARRRASSSGQDAPARPPSTAASSTATWSRSSASRALAPTACRSCTS